MSKYFDDAVDRLYITTKVMAHVDIAWGKFKENPHSEPANEALGNRMMRGTAFLTWSEQNWPSVAVGGIAATLELLNYIRTDLVYEFLLEQASGCLRESRRVLGIDIDTGRSHPTITNVLEIPPPRSGPFRRPWTMAAVWTSGAVRHDGAEHFSDFYAEPPDEANAYMWSQARAAVTELHSAIELGQGGQGL